MKTRKRRCRQGREGDNEGARARTRKRGRTSRHKERVDEDEGERVETKGEWVKTRESG